MIQYKKIIMTLVALLAVTTGAWADETPLVTITIGSDGNPVYSVEGLVTLTGTNYKTGSAGVYYWMPSDLKINLSATVAAAADNVSITKVVFWSTDMGEYTNPLEDTAAPYLCYANGSIEIRAKSLSDDFATKVDGYRIAKIEVFGTAAPAGTALTPDATRKVWTLDAMPAGNVELQVEYYPAMLTLAKAEGGSIEVVGLGEPIVAELKDIDGWKNDLTLLSAADLPGFVAISEDIAKTWNHTPASFLAEPLYYGFDGDDVEQIMFEDGAVFTRKGTITRDACYKTVKIVKSHIYYTTGVKMHDGFEQDDKGNIYVEAGTQFQVKAVPADGYHLVSLSDGTNTYKVDADGIATITMPEGDADLTLTATFSDQYELTFDDVNFKTNQNITVKVGDADKTLDQDGKLSVKSGQTVTLTAKQGYKFRSVEAKKAVKLQSITISGVTVYYAEGESWSDAIKRDENKDLGLFIREGNRVHHPTYGQLVDSNTQPVLPDAKINANESYKFIN